MNINNIEVKLVETDEGFAYDIEINNDGVTLSQYIEALDNFLDEKVAPCLGCDNCCYQRIPLILPDIYDYAGFQKDKAAAFISKNVTINKRGPALDIQLNQGVEGKCTFLDNEAQRCTDHQHRSLVCHTYICLPQTPRARELREYLINEGEDALIAELFHWGLLTKWPELQESYPLKSEWQNKTYSDILLKDILSPKLWGMLTDPK